MQEQENINLDIANVTKKFTNTLGIFNINIKINPGKTYGFIGPNGAGKTTLIRQIVGFIKSDNGNIFINNKNPWIDGKEIMKTLGYLPSETILPNYMTGEIFLKNIAKIRNNVDWVYTEKLISFFDINIKLKIKKMSKGMKQKIALISTFMHKPKILILDEPTTGLDPVMQQKFLRLLKEYKENKTTIFFSSHIFSEIEYLADWIGIIKKGKIISETNLKELKEEVNKTYLINFLNEKELKKFLKLNWKIKEVKNTAVKVFIESNEISLLLNDLSNFKITSYKQEEFKIENHFLKFYEEEINNEF